MSPLFLLLTLSGGALGLMLVLYGIQRRTGDAGIVDFGWTAGLGLAALYYAMLGPGDGAFRVGLALVACPWSLRLATYILRDRVMKGEEDGRYAMLREQWGRNASRNFLFFFLFQGVLVILFSLIYWGIAQRSGAFGWIQGLGVVVGWLAIGGEHLADAQLSRWRANDSNKGKTCRAGLWRYSRHPNYFFEWLHWWAYVLLAWGSAWIWLSLAGPAIMLLFLYRVTGIPYTEKQAIKSRGDDYRRYQQETSAFFPWFPRKADA